MRITRLPKTCTLETIEGLAAYAQARFEGRVEHNSKSAVVIGRLRFSAKLDPAERTKAMSGGVNFETWKHFFDALFLCYPEARVVTGYSTYENEKDFREQMELFK